MYGLVNMKIKVVVKTGQREQSVEEMDGFILVRVINRPIKNKANIELIKLLSSYFGKKVKMVSGANSKIKIIEVED